MTDMSDFDDVPNHVQVISQDMMRKRIIWDVAPDEIATKTSAYLGLHPASPDVESMERTEAYHRLNALGPITPLIGALSHFAAETVRGAMVVEHGKHAEDSPSLEVNMLTAFIAQSTMGILAELVDVGALHMPHIRADSST